MADTIKCPNCGSNLIFDADLQKLTCSSCGASLDPKELDTTVSELESKDDGEPSDNTTTADNEPNDTGNENIVEYVCNGCGAKVLADKMTSASFCAFCGSPALIGQKLTREFKPECIIPFKYGREKAVEGFFKWCKGGRMTPFGFVSDKNIEKLTGLYVPYWLSDYKVHVKYKATGVRDRRSPNGYGTVEYYDLQREANYNWNNVPFDAEVKLDDELMEAIEPFDFKELVPYDYKYLPGFFADCYELTPEDLKERIEHRAHEYMGQELAMTFGHFTRIDFKLKQEDLEHSEKYALLPVWFFACRYLGKKYTFVMNGQTGEVAGIPPVSLVKRIIIGMGILAILTVIVRFIAGLILWGVVG